jgi:hypothetical protein
VSRAGQVGALFPVPLVGAAVLVAILIVVTPALRPEGQPVAGSIFSQAELVVDALPGNNSTHFYVHALSTTARYSDIQLGFAYGFNWTGSFPPGPLNWTDWHNGSEVLSVDGAVDQDPIAVNVSALYTENGASALYVGIFAIDLSVPAGSTTQTLFVVSNTAGIGGFSISVANLPVPIPLTNVGPGGGP